MSDWRVINEPELNQLLTDYARALDAGDFSRWLTLFADDGVYRVLTRENQQRNEPIYLINDSKNALQLRIDAYADQSPSRTLHLITNAEVATSPTSPLTTIRANGIVIRSGIVAFAGIYYLDIGPDRLIESAVFVLEQTTVTEAIPLPI